ncbi:MAG: fimbrillin family protein, partial [Bacteroidaceae bacterium]|nr:fimbrillin family protein [Bacteroidaceae bacterium]
VFNGEDYPTTPTVISAQIEVVNTATIDLLADSLAFTPGSTKTEVSLKVKSSHAEGMAWSGYTVVIPGQDIKACKVTLSFTADGEKKSLTYTHGESLLFQSGKRTVLNLTVNKNKIEGLVGYAPDSDDSEFLN